MCVRGIIKLSGTVSPAVSSDPAGYGLGAGVGAAVGTPWPDRSRAFKAFYEGDEGDEELPSKAAEAAADAAAATQPQCGDVAAHGDVSPFGARRRPTQPSGSRTASRQPPADLQCVRSERGERLFVAELLIEPGKWPEAAHYGSRALSASRNCPHPDTLVRCLVSRAGAHENEFPGSISAALQLRCRPAVEAPMAM